MMPHGFACHDPDGVVERWEFEESGGVFAVHADSPDSMLTLGATVAEEKLPLTRDGVPVDLAVASCGGSGSWG